jgi:hypothetical protein
MTDRIKQWLEQTPEINIQKALENASRKPISFEERQTHLNQVIANVDILIEQPIILGYDPQDPFGRAKDGALQILKFVKILAEQHRLSPAEVVFMFVPRARAAVDTVDAATDLATETVSTTESVLETVTHSELPATEPLTDDISLCVTLGVPCHTIELGAFTLSPELTEKNLEQVDLNFSFGSAAPEGEGTDDKLVVRYYLNGQWRHGGEIFLNKEMSNAANGGYFTASLTDVREWEDLSDMRVVVEYVRADNRTFAELYLDSV